MRSTRLRGLAILAGVMVLVVAVVTVLDPRLAPSPSATPTTRPTPNGLPSPAALPPALVVDVADAGPAFVLDTSDEPTGDVGQSKLWFHDGAWWGVLIAEGSGAYHIHRFDWEGGRWIDTGAVVAPRASVQPDVVAEGESVWIATGGWATTSRAASLFRFSYDAEHGRYAPDPDLPVRIADERAEGLTLARDAEGRLWAAWIGESGLMVRRTNGNDLAWGVPYTPAVESAAGEIDTASVVSYGTTVALAWTRPGRNELTLAVAAGGTEDEWDASVIAVDGLAADDDQLHLAVLPDPSGSRLFAVIRASFGSGPNDNPGDPQIVLLVVEPDGTSHQHLVSRVTDRQTRPIVLLDAETRRVFVVAASQASGGAIRYKASDLDDIAFGEGEGTTLVDLDGIDALSAPTSTKGLIGAASGMLVLASDAEAGTHGWAAARLDFDDAPPASGGGVQPVPVVDPIAHDTFDPFDAGTPVGGAWDMSVEPGFVVADLDGRRVAAATVEGDGSSIRMCRDVAPVMTGTPSIVVEFLVSRMGSSDVTVTSVRHDREQSAVVRLDNGGTFSYFDGTQHVRSAVQYATGVWYTSTVDVDLGAGTYSWRVQRSSDGADVFDVEGAQWRAPSDGPLTGICLESATSTGSATTFAVDDVKVLP